MKYNKITLHKNNSDYKIYGNDIHELEFENNDELQKLLQFLSNAHIFNDEINIIKFILFKDNKLIFNHVIFNNINEDLYVQYHSNYLIDTYYNIISHYQNTYNDIIKICIIDVTTTYNIITKLLFNNTNHQYIIFYTKVLNYLKQKLK